MEVRVIDQGVDLSGATLVVGVMEGLEPVPGSESAFASADSSLLDAAGFEGKAGQTLAVGHPEAKTMLLVGMGEEADFDSLRTASGNAVRTAKTERLVSLLAQTGLEGATRAVAEGSLLGGYQFRSYKTNGDKVKVRTLEVVGGDSSEAAEATTICQSVIRARDWVNTPAMDLSPDQLASQMEEALTAVGVTVEVWDEKRIADEKLGALLGVAAGSDRPPRVVVATYRPDEAVFHLGLVGKGITFDTGGLSIKSASFMEEMKVDMGGAAAVAAATEAIARLGLSVAVTMVTPLTDNAVGATPRDRATSSGPSKARPSR
jgi:leucyl aminopeptidase